MAKSCHITRIVTLAAVLLASVSCVYDDYDAGTGTDGGNTIAVELSIQTHAATSTSETYVVGREWENYIDIAGGDYRIYFFTYDPTTETAGNGANSTLISEFKPDDIYSTDSGAYTTYRASGEVDASMAEYGNFKVVMLANWGAYPTVTAGTTTIDEICNAQTAVFDAFVDGSGDATLPSSTLHIPFFGVREYTGVNWESGKRTTLSGAVTLLRAVAKVEVIAESGVNQDLTFGDVSIVNYNAQGYCAPTNVYLKSDYDHDYTWNEDFVDGLHLVGGENDGDEKSMSFLKTSELETATDGSVTQYETWTCYLTEYDNSGNDYSYITVRIGNDTYPIYFGNYYDGTCGAYDGTGDTGDRFDIFRNNLYRFYVAYNGGNLRVVVNEWEDVFDNEWTVGETTPQEVGATFSVNGIMYEVLKSEFLGEFEGKLSYDLEVETTEGGTFETEVEIQETVRYHGFTYNLIGIGANTFDGQDQITSITLPETTTHIGSKAFKDCTSLTSLTILNWSEVTECETDAFAGVTTSNLTLYVPDEVAPLYRADEIWTGFGFKEIVGMDM